MLAHREERVSEKNKEGIQCLAELQSRQMNEDSTF